MAKDVHRREDLLRDATALVERIQLAGAAPELAEVFAGFRAGGSLSIYFGEDPVYHFNSDGQLRRAHVDSELIKAVAGNLVSLTRAEDRSSEMIRRDWSASATAAFCEQVSQRLATLCAASATGELRVVGQVPENADVLGRLQSWLASFDQVQVADSPRVA